MTPDEVIASLSLIRRHGFRPIFCNHPECPHENCLYNQRYITIDDLDRDILYIDMKCEKYLDI